jgi:hypothetical protein
MKKELKKTAFIIACMFVMLTGVQAQDQNPVGMTPTEQDAAGMTKMPSYSPSGGGVPLCPW